MDTKKIGAFLKQCRKENNLTQEQLAEKFGVSARTVSRWETGSNMPDLSILIELADYYDIEIKELLDGERSSTMNKEMKETLVLIISMIILTGCGGSGKTEEKNPYEGKWVAVSAQMMGMSVSIDETFGGAFEFEVKNNGKVSFSVGDTTGNGKWSVEDNQFILSIEGEEMVGIIGKDIISFDNMLEMGVKVIFAKDGTDAMDPALYLTEEENAVIGEWAAESVEELLGDGPQTSMEGVDNINDALRLDFKSDRNVTVIYKGEEIGTFPWSVALGYCSIESENPSLTVMINDDGTLKVDYSDDDDYYTFHCVKSDGE